MSLLSFGALPDVSHRSMKLRSGEVVHVDTVKVEKEGWKRTAKLTLYSDGRISFEALDEDGFVEWASENYARIYEPEGAEKFGEPDLRHLIEDNYGSKIVKDVWKETQVER